MPRRKVVIATGAGEQRTAPKARPKAKAKPRKRKPQSAGAVVTQASRDITRSARKVKRQGERVVGQVLVQAGRERRAKQRRANAAAAREYRASVAEARRLGQPRPPRPTLPGGREVREVERARIAYANRRPEPKPPGGLLGIALGHPLEMKGGLAERVGRGLLNVGSIPAGMTVLASQAGEAARKDLQHLGQETADIVRDPLRHDRKRHPSEVGKIGKEQGKGMAEALRHPGRDPVGAALTAGMVLGGASALRRAARRPAVPKRKPGRVVRTVPPEQVVGAARLGGGPKRVRRAEDIPVGTRGTIPGNIDPATGAAAMYEVVGHWRGNLTVRGPKGMEHKVSPSEFKPAHELAPDLELHESGQTSIGIAGEQRAIPSLRDDAPTNRALDELAPTEGKPSAPATRPTPPPRSLSAKPTVPRAKPKPQPKAAKPKTVPAMRARLAELDKKYEALVKQVAERVDPYASTTAKQHETLYRNRTRNRLKGGIRRGNMATVNAEIRALAEAKIDAIARKNPDLPAARTVLERDELRARLNALAEEQFGPEPAPYTVRARPTSRDQLRGLYQEARVVRGEHETLVGQAAKAAGATAKRGTVKTPGRALEKIRADYGGDATKIKDIVRGQVRVDSAQQLDAVVAYLRAHSDVVKVKDTLTKRDPDTGFGDIKVYVRHKNGHVAEVQILPRQVAEIQEQLHPLYREARGRKNAAGTELVNARMKTAYDAAYSRLSRSNSWRSIGNLESVQRVQGRGSGVQTVYSREPSPRVTAETGASSTSKRSASGGGDLAKRPTADIVPPRGEAVAAPRLFEPEPAVAQMPQAVKSVEFRPERATPAELKVRESLGPARARRAAQEGLYREERSRRVAKAQAAQEAAGGGFEGFKASKAQLRGELPKVKFEHLREGRLTDADFEGLLRTVQAHPELQWFEKLNTQTALANAFERGVTPTKSEIELLRRAFGEETANVLQSRWGKPWELAVDALNIPRSFMASLDVSAPFRQGIGFLAASPRQFFKNFKPMFETLTSEKNYQALLDSLHEHPRFDLAERAGVNFTELRGPTSKFREEQFSSQLAETITGGRYSPVRASGRAYTAFLDKSRLDMFSELVDVAQKAGVNVESMRELRGIASLVNAATGRGGLGRFETWGPALNGIFFAPRLIASRVNMFLMPFNPKQTKFARLEAMRTMSRLMGGAALVLTLAKWAGADVELDPRSSDFAKIKVRNTRVDVLGGFQQYVRLVAQVASGQTVSSTTGQMTSLGSGFGERSRKDIIQRFLEGKLAPPASFVNEFFQGTDFQGEPFEVKRAVLNRMIPLAIQDAMDLQRETGSFPLAGLGYQLAAFGFGVQTYSTDPSAKIKKRHQGYEKEILDIVKQAGLAGQNENELRPPLKRALQLRAERFSFRAERGAADIREKFASDVLFLAKHGIGNKAKAERAIRWANSEKRDWIVRHEMSSVLGPYFDDLYGDAISDLRYKVRERGYDLPTIR